MKKQFKNGTYSFAVIAIVLIIVVMINLLVAQIPSEYRKLDATATDLFALSDTTKEVLHNLNKDVTLYTIAQVGNENRYVENFVQLYMNESDHIKHETIDPILNPQFIEDYGENLSQGSLMVECGDAHDGIELNDMFITTTDSATNIDSITGVDCEGLITSAIVRLSGDYTPKLYEVSGFEETPLTRRQGSYISRQNIDVGELDFSQTTEIPEDADMLLFNLPLTDLTDAQLEAVSQFMDSGKSVVLIMDTAQIKISNRLKNFDKLMEKVGIGIEYKTVLEGDNQYWMNENSPYFCRAQLVDHSATHICVEEKRSVVLAMADNIKILDQNRDDLVIEPLAQSSSTAYLKEQGSATMAQLPTDETGTFNYGMAVTNTETNGRFLLYSSRSMVQSTENTTLDENNQRLLVSSIRWLAGQAEDVLITVKSLAPADLVVSDKEVNVYTVIVVLVFPAIVLGYGLLVWNRRRKR